MFRLGVLLCALVVGCAATPASAPPSTPAAGEWTASPGHEIGGQSRLYDDSGRASASSTVIFEPEMEGDRFATKTIAGSQAAAAPRPRRVGKRDISFVGARLDNVLRMLAREGRFNLVLESNLTQPVTVELKRVEPFDAAQAIAEANHLSLRYRRGIVMVGHPTKP